MTNQPKRLVRVTDGAKIAGVCEGFSRYFKVDPTFVRLAFLLLAMLGGPGLLLYLACWLAMPLAAGNDWFD
jgi:phage shock protein PspC (stress-responsive transcriptional regulator)